MSTERSGAREVAVGTMMIVAAIAFVLGTNWLNGRQFAARRSVEIVFKDVNGIKVGSPVKIAGYQIGRVAAMVLQGRDRVFVTATLPDTLVPRADASASIRSQGIVGDAWLDFDPGISPTPLPEGTRVIGGETGGLLDRAAKLGDRADSLLLGAQRVLSPGVAARLTDALDAMKAALQATTKTMELYGREDRGPARELTLTLQQAQRATARLDSVLANPGLQRALTASDTLVRDLGAMSRQVAATGARLDSLLARLDRGEGTAGRILADTALYHNLVGTSARLDSLLRDLQKHPGKLGITVKMF